MWLVSAWPVGGNLPFQLKPGEFTIGRAKENAINLYDSSISRIHARIYVSQSGDITIEDLASRNGMDVNGKLTHFGCLRVGDRLRLGAVPCLIMHEPSLRSRSLGEDSTVVHMLTEEMPLLRIDSGLSIPQREVLGLIASGLTEEEVAGKTGRSYHTVHNHVRAIYKAYGVHSRRELLARLGQQLAGNRDFRRDDAASRKE